MTKHVIDQPSARIDGLRVRHYMNLERAQNPAQATKMLQRRIRKGKASPRLMAFLRIERGQTA